MGNEFKYRAADGSHNVRPNVRFYLKLFIRQISDLQVSSLEPAVPGPRKSWLILCAQRRSEALATSCTPRRSGYL